MLRAARPGDEPALEAFLAGHADTAMFLRANLARFGLAGADDPRATAFWLAESGGRVRAVFGLSNAGFAMCEAAGAGAGDWPAFARAVAGRRLTGLAGAPGQIARLKAALGVAAARYALDAPEPLYRLELAALRGAGLPDGRLRRPAEADRPLLERWNAAYVEELRMTTPDRRDAEARLRATRAIAGGDTRLLEVGGAAVAMTAVNARLPEMVQIGGVYTPPDRRGRHYARTAVARHLAELRAEGLRRAILFASGPAACRAYEALGFERVGHYTLAILAEPVIIGRLAA